MAECLEACLGALQRGGVDLRMRPLEKQHTGVVRDARKGRTWWHCCGV